MGLLIDERKFRLIVPTTTRGFSQKKALRGLGLKFRRFTTYYSILGAASSWRSLSSRPAPGLIFQGFLTYPKYTEPPMFA